MILPNHKTKIVCTIGPACRGEDVLEKMMKAGMNVARLNLAHGTMESHREDIRRIKAAAQKTCRRCLIFADLPGPKIRIGKLAAEPLILRKGEQIVLSADKSTEGAIPVEYEKLPKVVSVGGLIYINDGFIQVEVEKICGGDIFCRVLVGGPLLSFKGLNLPAVRIEDDVLSGEDYDLADFAMDEGIEALSVSFVRSGKDIRKLRDHAKTRRKKIFIIAKIERIEAIESIDGILQAADGIMIARGDLGVQTPIEDVPALQKKIIRKANILGKPVITATQMLVSMTDNVRPTRAEVSDVANAILDGTDAVMLSEESAIGKYPVEAVEMMSKISASIEKEFDVIKQMSDLQNFFRKGADGANIAAQDIVSLTAVEAAQLMDVRYILVPTHYGGVPRLVSRFKPESWIIAFGESESVNNLLCLSYGVHPVLLQSSGKPLSERATDFLEREGLAQKEDKLVLVEGGPARQVNRIDSLNIFTMR